MIAAASRRSRPRSRWPNRVVAVRWYDARQLPRREVEQRDDDRQPGQERHGRRRPRGTRRRPRRRRSPATRRRSRRPLSTNGSIVRAAERRRCVGGRSRRPTISRSGKAIVGSSRSERRRRANDSPASGSASNAPSRPRGRRRSSGARSGSWIGRASRTTRTPAAARRLRRPTGRDERPAERRRRHGHRGSGPASGAGLLGASRRCAGDRSRTRSSSSRSWTTTTSASTTIRRLIFDWPDAPVAERDRDLADASAATRRPERHLDLEDVAAGMDAVERDRRQGRRPPRLEAAGQVVRREAAGRSGRRGCRRARSAAGRSPSRRRRRPAT